MPKVNGRLSLANVISHNAYDLIIKVSFTCMGFGTTTSLTNPRVIYTLRVQFIIIFIIDKMLCTRWNLKGMGGCLVYLKCNIKYDLMTKFWIDFKRIMENQLWTISVHLTLATNHWWSYNSFRSISFYKYIKISNRSEITWSMV